MQQAKQEPTSLQARADFSSEIILKNTVITEMVSFSSILKKNQGCKKKNNLQIILLRQNDFGIGLSSNFQDDCNQAYFHFREHIFEVLYGMCVIVSI